MNPTVDLDVDDVMYDPDMPPPGGNPPSDRKKPLPPPPFGGPRPPPSPSSSPPPAPPPVAVPHTPSAPQAAPPPPAAAQPPASGRAQRPTNPPPSAPDSSRSKRASNPPPVGPEASRPHRASHPPPVGPEPAKLPPAPMPPSPAPPPATLATAIGVPAAPGGASAPPAASAPPPVSAPAPVASSTPASHGPSSASRLPLQAPDAFASPPPGQPPFEIPPLPADINVSPWKPFAEFAKMSFKRAFRVRIDPNEITTDERTSLDKALVVFPSMRSFLTWRRSVLFGFATFLGVLVVLRAIELFDKDNIPDYLHDGSSTIQGLNIVSLVIDAAFCGLCWWQWTKWTDWKKQRQMLFLGWLVYFFAPFVLSLYPLRTTLSISETTVEGKTAATTVGMVFAIQTLIALGPRALAFLPGVARGATATKFLFPQSPVPGWMMVALTPLYALFLVVILLIPYQVTASGYYVLSIGGFLGGAYIVTRAAWTLRGPSDRDQTKRALDRIRTGYYIALGVGVVFLLVGLAELIDQVDFKPITVVNLFGVGLANVWILTLVSTDQLIAHLEAGQHIDGFKPPPALPPA